VDGIIFHPFGIKKPLFNKRENATPFAINLEETIAHNLQQSEALRQSILKKAFEGKLVEQDTKDEPTSKL
jgi:hypothetical protein